MLRSKPRFDPLTAPPPSPTLRLVYPTLKTAYYGKILDAPEGWEGGWGSRARGRGRRGRGRGGGGEGDDDLCTSPRLRATVALTCIVGWGHEIVGTWPCHPVVAWVRLQLYTPCLCLALPHHRLGLLWLAFVFAFGWPLPLPLAGLALPCLVTPRLAEPTRDPRTSPYALVFSASFCC